MTPAELDAITLNDIPALLEEIERLREALERILDYRPEFVQERAEDIAAAETCILCRGFRERGWPPSGRCNEHYQTLAAVNGTNQRRMSGQWVELKDIARSALSPGKPRGDALREEQLADPAVQERVRHIFADAKAGKFGPGVTAQELPAFLAEQRALSETGES